MPFYRMPDGTHAHINFGSRGNKKAPRPCASRRLDGTICGVMAGYQCDWILATACTCGRHLCTDHAFEAAGDKHLCPEHVNSYIAWLRGQCIAY